MKKRWIPFIFTLIATAAIFGLRFGAQFETDRQTDMQNTGRHLNTTIAVVNGDAGIMVNGGWYNYSAAIINTLGDDFVLVSPAMAQTGFASGAYAAVVTFPSNVSARILSFNAMGPERVELEFQINQNLSEREYLETFIAITELQLAINTTLASTYVSSILHQFHYAQDHVAGIFQNNLADLLALEIITLGDFTANLELDDVPFVPIQPRELDTPFYMTQVRAFAEEVAGWYLHSYAMASNQFLWMRDGLIRLTDNFPVQEENWVHMMMAWTRYSEFYGELLDIFFEDVSLHEDELRDWHLETMAWHEALERYQTQVLGWHDISDEWWWDAGEWHFDYMVFLRSLQEYAYELDRHHTALDESLQPVMDDLEEWRRTLHDYELLMRMQYENLQRMILEYTDKATLTTWFLGELIIWYFEMGQHHGTLGRWYGELNHLHGNLNFALDTFWDGFDGLPTMPVDLPTDGFPVIPSVNPVPDVTSGAALTVTIRVWSEEYLDYEYVEYNVFDMLDNLPNNEFDAISSSLDELLGGLTDLGDTLGDLLLDLDYAIYELEMLEILPITISFDQFQVPIPATPCINIFPQSMFMENVFTTSPGAISVSFVPAQFCYVCNFLAQLEEFVYNLNQYVGTLNDDVEILNSHAETLNSGADILMGSVITLQYSVEERLPVYVNTIRDYSAGISHHTNILAYGVELLESWYLCLQLNIANIYEWYLEIVDFHDETMLLYQQVQEAIDDIAYWHDAALAFEITLDGINASELLCIEELKYVTRLVHEYMPDNVCEDYWSHLLEWYSLEEWREDIVKPSEYDGAEMYGVFDVDFPLDFNEISEVLNLYRPPIFTDYDVPQIVHEHWMLLAYRPTSPLIPPPPRPDDFWHSLNFMHDQLMSFDVEDFLGDDIHQRVERSLVSYEAFLESIRHDITFLFQDNIWLMHDVNTEYNHFLRNLRYDAFVAAAYEQYALQNAINTFVTLREINNANTISRLGTFANLMPESRAVTGVNQGLVNFTVMPFDFVPMTIRDEVVFEQPSSMVEVYVQWQRIALWVVGAVFVVTVGSLVVTAMRKKK